MITLSQARAAQSLASADLRHISVLGSIAVEQENGDHFLLVTLFRALPANEYLPKTLFGVPVKTKVLS